MAKNDATGTFLLLCQNAISLKSHVNAEEDWNELSLRGNVGENQRGAPTCRRNLCSYSGYQKYLWIQGPYGPRTLYS